MARTLRTSSPPTLAGCWLSTSSRRGLPQPDLNRSGIHLQARHCAGLSLTQEAPVALNGVDISGHQTDATVTEWLPLVDFVIVKATEGKGTTSAAWAPRVALARGAGKLVGHYH